MSNEKEPINLENTDETENSTIFSDPSHYNTENETKNAVKRPLLIKALSALVAVAVLAVGTFAAFKLIPEKVTDETPDTTVSVTAFAETDAKNLSVKNELGTVVLNAEIVETNGESSVNWTVDGVDTSLTSSSAISSFSKNVLGLNALEKLAADGTDFGFEKPSAQVVVQLNDGSYTLTVGKATPSSIGYYCKLSTDTENVYIINSSVAETLSSTTDTAFADTTGFVSVKNDNNASCFTEDAIITFDYISISGKKHPTPFKIEYLDDADYNTFFSFKMVSPTVRICDNDVPQTVLDAFSAGFSVSGAYCYTPSADDLKKYGLSDPDYIVTLCLKGEKFTLKFSEQADGYLAFIDGKTDMIQKVAPDTVAFATNSIEKYYSQFVVLENLNGIRQLKVETNKSVYLFDIAYTENPEGNLDQYEAKFGDTVLDIDNFKNYYKTIVNFAPISFETVAVGKPYVKITFVHSSEHSDTVLTFTKASSLRYQAEIGGIPVGQITSSVLEKFIDDTVKASKNENVN